MVYPTALTQLRVAYRKLPLVRRSQCLQHLHNSMHNTSPLLIANVARPVFLRLSEYASFVHSNIAVSQSRGICLDVKLRSKASHGEDKEQVSVQRAQSGPRLTAGQKGSHPVFIRACSGYVVVMFVSIYVQ